MFGNKDDLNLIWCFCIKYYNMIDIDFNAYFIKNYNCYDLHGHNHHIKQNVDPILIVILTFSFIEQTQFGTI